MDVLGFAAAIGQLLAQVVSLYQQVDAARHAVRTAPKVLNDTTTQLLTLSDILRDVENEKALHTEAISTQLGFVKDITNELRRILESMRILQRRSRLQQGLRALSRGQRDEAKLAEVLKRLEEAKTMLLLRISVAHIGLTGCLAEEVRNVVQTERALASRPVDKSSTEASRAANTTDEEVRLTATTAEDNQPGKVENAHLRSKQKSNPVQLNNNTATRRRSSEEVETSHELVVRGNGTSGSAHQINGIVGIEGSKMVTKACILENQATGMSRQQNLILGNSSALHIIRRLCL
ncbi:hypothetical protein F4809DRAFT_630252 [Biscogniauxia mediterranea]|nr:hypothetical protein F4809DRAFT_630252 [Biscogniauxia mediterranea]